MRRRDVQIAWREKVALNVIILAMCALLLFFIVGLGLILCPKTSALSQGEIDGRRDIGKPVVSMYGYYYRISDIVRSHVFDSMFLNEQALKDTVLGRDVSSMFFKTDLWSRNCPGLPPPTPGWDNIRRAVPKDAMTVWLFHREKDKVSRPKDYLQLVAYMRKGPIARDRAFVERALADDPVNNYIITAYDRVYDVSMYMDPTNQANFLGNNMHDIFRTLGQSTKDATQYIERVKVAEGVAKWRQYMTCMDNIFFVGIVDHRMDAKCVFANYLMLAASIVLVAVIGFKFIAALQLSPKGNPESRDKFVICCVPCFSEGADSLRATIDSIAASNFDASRMLMFIIADGNVMGAGNSLTTPQLVLDVLGVDDADVTDQSECFAFQSLGEGALQYNQAKVYSGLYAHLGRRVPFIAVIKIGGPHETHRAGNRGKRDSQLLLMRFLNRVHGRKEMFPLEVELMRHFCDIIGVSPAKYEFLLWVDADTEIFPDAINHYVSAMAGDALISGICGETVLRNEGDSWVTMIQVYEYFISHHLAKAFESLFGSVTCLPGCFCMYRIFSPTTRAPLLVSSSVLADYGENNVNTLHLKNLLSLGEDRYLTTLMLKHFPGHKSKFTPDARAKTSAPNTWGVLISQRRRWINSTVHNLVELLLLRNLCGFCLFSMRMVVFLDLFATVVAPAGVVYIAYLITTLVLDDESQVPLISLIMIAAIYGLQVVIFVLKREWQHIGWMIVYILATPLFSFCIPIYAFWRFDDFSWGETRTLVDSAGAGDTARGTGKAVAEFDPASIPLIRVLAAPRSGSRSTGVPSTAPSPDQQRAVHSDLGDGGDRNDDDDDDAPVGASLGFRAAAGVGHLQTPGSGVPHNSA
ncbi:hypothetical protein HK105_207739 [Polyrhizophydium stewartii]|uniref:chitin synthase n=1 Tax=Polyrhizophydium stewartii TaxID=2732419 RepID=A0ABR4MZP7_9FUNG